MSMEIKLRPWAETDLENLVQYANNWNIAKFMTDQFAHPYNENNGKAFIKFATSEDPIHIFAIDLDGQAVGGIGLHPMLDIQRKNAELGYWLAEPFWGKGIMAKAIPMIVRIGFELYPINRIFARPFGSNLASQKVLEKSNFKLEAKFENTLFKDGKYEDELFYSILRKDWVENI